MQSTLNISLPPALRQWVNQQIETRGFATADELIRDMIRREREKSLRYQIDAKLKAALQTPLSEFTDGDWKDIRRQGRKLATARK